MNSRGMIGFCEHHGKVLFCSRRYVRRYNRRWPEDHKRAFPCEFHEGFHSGTLPGSVIQGAMTMQEWRRDRTG